MPSISYADAKAAKSAARAASNLITGWGDAKDAGVVADFLAQVEENPALYTPFRDAFQGGKDAWHPALLKEKLAGNFETEADEAKLIGAGTPLGVRLAQLADKPAPAVDPDRVGKAIKDFTTGWFGAEELQVLITQLPATLDDAFAFAAARAASGRTIDEDASPADVRAQLKQSVAYEMKEGGRDAAQTKLLKMLAERL